ncbi:hypothetical protein [Actinoplanes sp. NPDC049118]|uniref:hypothetical protein n=1 Tax=Actinoplanes sp. NPDC049118 TaxID=3155769 RepID=UPI0033E02E63
MIEHLSWLSEQAAEGRRVDTDELWTLLYLRLGENRPLTDRIWRAWVTKPEGLGRPGGAR